MVKVICKSNRQFTIKSNPLVDNKPIKINTRVLVKMCGIHVVLGPDPDGAYLEAGHLIKHRGPDGTQVYENFMFHRLSINDTTKYGMQPFVRGKKVLVCNGEIYNHKEISGVTKSDSDCEKLFALFDDYGVLEGTKMIDGVFAFAYYDGKNTFIARDPIGVRPLFYCRTDEGGMVFSSEHKALPAKYKVHIFPPGHIYDHAADRFVNWYPCYWNENPHLYPSDIRPAFIRAVKKRIENTDRNIGFFLSGGLDSSLVAAIATKTLGTIRTFAIGTDENSPDLVAARKVSKHLKSDHTEVYFTPEEGFAVIPEVIRAIETYDTTTVRASVPMYMLSEWISKNTDIKVILSGEGSDELFGGYLYFHGAPDEKSFHAENMRLVKNLHMYDVLRADRCTAAHGLELRVPFLDKSFVDTVMTVRVENRLPHKGIEKAVLRNLFMDWLPHDILWRQKNAFSDAVGYDWVDYIRDVTSTFMENSAVYEHNQPVTNEEMCYRRAFEKFYPGRAHLIGELWRPKWTTETDPSARKLNIFSS
jgi:asparagine synthase (glutamine-hydrolysing)